MPPLPPDRSDSPPVTDRITEAVITGGGLPGVAHGVAWRLYGANPSRIPVLIAVPHAGRLYPEAVRANLRNPDEAMLRLEDRYVDRVAEAIARVTGAALLVAEAPRAMIDLNRAPDDIDQDMFEDGPAAEASPTAPVARAASGLGLIPRRVAGLGELWRHPHQRAELAARIAMIHAPYHHQLGETLAMMRARWGAALLIDLHSMPSLSPSGGTPAPDFVLGDRFGASCEGKLVASAFAYFARARRLVAHNRPYPGGYGLERHAAPTRGIHALQIEIDRALYLDAALDAPGEGLAETVTLLAGLVRQLATAVALLGAGNLPASWPEAAE